MQRRAVRIILALALVGLALAVLPSGSAAPSAPPFLGRTTAAKPVITRLSPSVGAAAGGTPVVLKGRHLERVKWVKFGNRKAIKVRVKKANKIKVWAPPGTPGTVKVRVRTRAGKSKPTARTRFTYVAQAQGTIAAPVISGMSSHDGPVTGGTVVVTGSGFTDTTQVAFDDLEAAGFQILSDGQIRVEVPASWATTRNLRIVTPRGESAVNSATSYTWHEVSVTPAHEIKPAAGTVTLAPEDVAAVSRTSPDRAAGPVAAGDTTWDVGLVAGAPVPDVGTKVLLLPGNAVHPQGIAGQVNAVDDDPAGGVVLAVGSLPLDEVLGSVRVSSDADGFDQMAPALATRRAIASADDVEVGDEIGIPKLPGSLFACKGENDETVALAGTISLRVTNFHHHYDWVDADFGNSPKVEVWNSYTVVASGDIALEASTTCSLPKAVVDRLSLRVPLGSSPFQFKIAPEVSLKFGGGGRMTFSQSTKYFQGFSATLDGVERYDTSSRSPIEMSVSGTLAAELYLGVNLELTTFDAAGVGLGVGGGLKGELTVTSPTPTADASVCVEIAPFLRFKLYAYLTFFNHRWDAIDFHLDLNLDGWEKCWGGDHVVGPQPAVPDQHPEIATTGLPTATAGEPYTVQLEIVDHRPGSWSEFHSTTLPVGLALSSDGLISGVPLRAGSTEVDLGFLDQDGNPAFETFTLVVQPASTDVGGNVLQATDLPLPVDATDTAPDSSRVDVLDCGPTRCAAAGGYRDQSGNWHDDLIWSYDGVQWSVAALPSPSGDATRWNADVLSCGDSVCAATGRYVTSWGAYYPATWVWADAGWTLAQPPAPDGFADLYGGMSLACAGDHCAAAMATNTAGYGAVLWEWSSGSWQATPVPEVDTDAGVGRLACNAVNCVALGTRTDHATGTSELWLWTLTDGTWVESSAPRPAGFDNPLNYGTGLRCGPEACVATADYKSTPTHPASTVLWTLAGGAWIGTEAPRPGESSSGSTDTSFGGDPIGCRADGCVVGGRYYGGGGPSFVWWTWSTGGWSVRLTATDGTTTIPTEVGCSASLCAATGSRSAGSDQVPYLWSGAGLDGSLAELDDTEHSSPSATDVACALSLCVAAGASRTPADNVAPAVWVWRDGAWSHPDLVGARTQISNPELTPACTDSICFLTSSYAADHALFWSAPSS